MRKAKRIGWNLLPPLTFVAIVALWAVAIPIFKIPAYLLPGPGGVFSRIISDFPMLWNHSLVTLTEIVLGFGADCVDSNTARAAHRPFAAGKADRLPAFDADAAGAENCGRAALSGVVGLRNGVESSADGADDIFPVAPGQYQRVPDSRQLAFCT